MVRRQGNPTDLILPLNKKVLNKAPDPELIAHYHSIYTFEELWECVEKRETHVELLMEVHRRIAESHYFSMEQNSVNYKYREHDCEPIDPKRQAQRSNLVLEYYETSGRRRWTTLIRREKNGAPA